MLVISREWLTDGEEELKKFVDVDLALLVKVEKVKEAIKEVEKEAEARVFASDEWEVALEGLELLAELVSLVKFEEEVDLIETNEEVISDDKNAVFKV